MFVMICTTTRPMRTSRDSRLNTDHTAPVSSSVEPMVKDGSDSKLEVSSEPEEEEVESVMGEEAPLGRFNLIVPAGRGAAAGSAASAGRPGENVAGAEEGVSRTVGRLPMRMVRGDAAPPPAAGAEAFSGIFDVSSNAVRRL